MSVNSGFATRQQQKKYNQYLQTILSVFAKRLVKFYTGQECDQPRFKHIILHLYDKMFKMEESKFMEPHYSYIVKDVIMNLHSIYDGFGGGHKEGSFKDYDQDFRQSSYKEKIRPHIDYPSKVHRKDFSAVDHQFQKSQKKLHFTSTNFKKRINTINTQSLVNHHYFTPQKNNSQPQQNQRSKKQQNKESLFKYKNEKISNSNIKQIHPSNKLTKIQRTNTNLSPTQFLKQVVNSQQDKQNISHLVLRTKQKHQKIIYN